MLPTEDELFERVVNIIRPLVLNENEYNEICNLMNKAMTMGLKKDMRDKSSIKMFPSYVSRIPDGHEKGEYMALDLGGTNYRVLKVTLGGKSVAPIIEERTYTIPRSYMMGSSQDLFKYIAGTLHDFIKDHELLGCDYDLGFTFSFPCDQKGLNRATLVRWTKGFAVAGMENMNLSELLQKEINAQNLRVNCVAIVNDTVGTLASCALADPRCAVGLIVGTGTNAAYVESGDLVEVMDEKVDQVVINTEWGAFGDCGELDKWITQFDKAVDSKSLHPGIQKYEKLISGMYLGEIVREILLYLTKEKLLFQGNVNETLSTPGTMLTKYLTDIERDPPHLSYSAEYVLTQDLKLPVVERIDAKIVRYVCECVTKRAAYLAGAGIACLLRRINRPHVTVGVDGSLFKFHTRFAEHMTYMVDRLRPSYTSFCLRLSEDGSGKGAAAIAAAATTCK